MTGSIADDAEVKALPPRFTPSDVYDRQIFNAEITRDTTVQHVGTLRGMDTGPNPKTLHGSTRE